MCLLPLLLYRVEQKRQRRAGAAGVVPPAAALDAAAVPPGAQAMDAAVPAKPPVQFEANEAVNPAMMPLRYWRCGKLCASPAERHAHVLQLIFDIAVSLTIVGFVFLGLCLAGQFPASVEVQKYVGTYSKNIAKYSMYAFTGLVGCIAPLAAARALRRGASLKPAFWIFQLSLLSVLACIGLSIYLFEKGSEMGMDWWMYLLSALMIVQRLLYFCVAAMASMSLWQAMSNTEVRRLMAHGTWDAPLRAASGPAGKGGDVEVGKV